MNELEMGGTPSTTEATTSGSESASSQSETTTPQSTPVSGLDSLRKLASNLDSKAEKVPSPDASGAMKTPAPPVETPYAPNFKVKYFDHENKKQIEKEIDEWAKSVIKDKETEAKVLKTFEKAYGLEAAVSSRDKHKSEATTLRQELTDFKKSLDVVSGFVQKDDMHSFFQSLKIPEEKVLKYALERLQYREWTPEQRAAYDGQRDTAAKAAYFEQQNEALAQQMQEIGVQNRVSELRQVMNDPTVRSVAQAFDQRMGEGSFLREVQNRGMLYSTHYDKDIPAQQAVNEVMQLIGGLPQSAPQPQTAPPQEFANQGSQPGTQAAPHQAPEVRKPIIPNIQGSGASPVKRAPRSIEDLKKLSQQMSG